MIPPKEFAEKLGAKYQTVMLWLRQGLIEDAEKHPLPTGGHYYLIPADASKPETQRGPKPKPPATAETAAPAASVTATAAQPKKAAAGKGTAVQTKPAQKRTAKKGK